jgi:CheY-like chemotaxis protein
MKMACQRTGIPHSFQAVTDGDAAIKYLAGEGEYSNRTNFPLPDLVFLDVRIPKRGGHEVLEWIRDQDQFKHLPVVIITHSAHVEDMDRAYRLGVTSYLRKVASQAEFGQAVRVILKYWLELNIMPTEREEKPVQRAKT